MAIPQISLDVEVSNFFFISGSCSHSVWTARTILQRSLALSQTVSTTPHSLLVSSCPTFTYPSSNAEWDIEDRKPSKKRKVFDGVLIPAFNGELQLSPKLEEQYVHRKLYLLDLYVVFRSLRVVPSQIRNHATSNSGPGDTDSETDEKPDLTSLHAEVCSGFLEGSLFKVTSIQEYEIKPKIKAEMNIDSNTFRERIARVSAPRYPVTLEPESARWQTVSRKFISRTYGGSEVSTFPMIDPKKVAKHGREFWMFWSLEKHPDAPKRPGEPGIWYDSSPMEYTEDFDIVRHGFARMKSDKWLYLGDYKQCATEALTQREWLLQSDKVRPPCFRTKCAS